MKSRTAINFTEVIDYSNVTYYDDMVRLPISSPSLIRDLNITINEAAAEHDIAWVDCGKTKFELCMDMSSQNFNCFLEITVFPLKFDKEEENRFLITMPEVYTDGRKCLKYCCDMANEFYANPDWEKEGFVKSSIDIELDIDEVKKLMWEVTQYLIHLLLKDKQNRTA